MNDALADAAWIAERLPPVKKVERRSEADYYGASHLIAGLLGQRTARRSFATWSHAWQIEPTTHPHQVLCVTDGEQSHLVATEAHAELLKRAGYRNVAPVGLPYLYADGVQVARRPGSLLVMPVHTLKYAKYDWDQEGYVSLIAALKSRFSCIVACVQSNCVEQGYWTEAFAAHGIPWIAGAASDDANALPRMTTILKSFEYVTTNRVASHVPYAAYSGCKVSVHGTYIAPRMEDYINHPFYKQHPALLPLHLERAQESEVRRRYGQFFRPPHEAVQQCDWARETLGADFRRTPAEIARLLGWTMTSQTAGYLRRAGNYSRRRAWKVCQSAAKRLPGIRRRAAA